MTCQYFTYGVDQHQHCHTKVGCNLRQKQLQQGQHLKKRCKLWAPTWQKEVGKVGDLGIDAGQAGFECALVQVSEFVMLTPD